MIGAAMAFALFGGLFSGKSHAVQRYQMQGWTVELKTDSFTGAVSCRLRAKDVTVDRGAAAFDFGGGVNTAEAVYRIDGGAARSGRIAMMDVAELGVRTITASPHNPTGGFVRIPAAELSGAASVAIRPNQYHAVRSFTLSGLDEALAAEKQRGCDQRLPF